MKHGLDHANKLLSNSLFSRYSWRANMDMIIMVIKQQSNQVESIVGIHPPTASRITERQTMSKNRDKVSVSSYFSINII